MTLLKIIQGTPSWVFALFLYLMFVGWKARRPATIPMSKLWTIPLVFTAWSLYSLKSRFGYSPISVSLYSLGLGLGIYLGYLLHRIRNYQVNRQKQQITIPGSLLPLIQFILIFACRYFFNASYAIHPRWQVEPLFFGPDIALSGFLTGLFIGKLLVCFRAYKHTTPG